MKKFVFGFILLGLLVSCNNFFEKESVWSDSFGNKIIYDWGFGDASIIYTNSTGKELKLCNYAYADANERVILEVSPDSSKVCLLFTSSSNVDVYPLGCGLRIYQLSNTGNDLSLKGTSKNYVLRNPISQKTRKSLHDNGIKVNYQIFQSASTDFLISKQERMQIPFKNSPIEIYNDTCCMSNSLN